jgi:hypothetical protein
MPVSLMKSKIGQYKDKTESLSLSQKSRWLINNQATAFI